MKKYMFINVEGGKQFEKLVNGSSLQGWSVHSWSRYNEEKPDGEPGLFYEILLKREEPEA